MTVRITNAEIQAGAHRFARALDDAGVSPRGTVAVVLPNVPEFLEIVRACSWSGRTIVPISWHLATGDVAYVVENSEADALVVHADFEALATAVDAFVDARARFAVGGALDGYRPWSEVEAFDAGELDAPVAGRVMLYTSGTTGRPKGVVPKPAADQPPPPFSSRMGSMMLEASLGDAASGAHLVVGPLYHAGPLTYAEGAALLGADVVLMRTWDAAEVLRTVEAERVVSTFMVPTHFVRLLRLSQAERERHDLSTLRLVCHGAAPVSIDVKRRMIEWLGPVLFEFYGGTEGGGVAIDSHDWLAHPGSVGKPRPGLEVHILDEDGAPLPPGETGDVYFRSADASFEYKGDAAKTAAAHRGAMYTLGDVGRIDDEGFLYLCDRKADTIISGGVNIYPAQVEDVLALHPGVADCCVIGLLDDEWGETVLAVVQPTEEAADVAALEGALAKLCDEKLGRIQHPRRYAFTAALPRTESGKIQRRVVRDRYRGEPEAS